jgi:hypothetical protein
VLFNRQESVIIPHISTCLEYAYLSPELTRYWVIKTGKRASSQVKDERSTEFFTKSNPVDRHPWLAKMGRGSRDLFYPVDSVIYSFFSRIFHIWWRGNYSSKVTLFEHLYCCLSFLNFQVDPLFQGPYSSRSVFVFLFSAHPNTSWGLHPIFCSFIHFMNLKVGSIDWTFVCIAEWLIELNIDWSIDWIFVLLIDLLIDYFALVTLCTCVYPVCNSPNFGPSHFIDWLLWGQPEVAPTITAAKSAKRNKHIIYTNIYLLFVLFYRQESVW